MVLITLALLSPMPATAERIIQLEPGLWEYSYDLEIPGLPIPSGSAKTKCISAKEAKQNLADLLAKLAINNTQCTVTDMNDTLSTLKFHIICRPQINGIDFTASGNAAFRYGRTKITGSVSAMVLIKGGEPIYVVGQGQAHRVGRCPK